MYSREVIDEVISRNDIVDVISGYVKLKKNGSSYTGLCPFHNEKSPSFSVSPDKQIFHCFGCGVGGNVFTFISKIEGIGFKEAIENLADRAGIVLPKSENNEDSKKEELKSKVYKVNNFTADYYHKRLYEPKSKAGQEYVKQRKLTSETLESYNLGFSGNYDELYRVLKKEGFNDEEIFESGLVKKNEQGQYVDFYRDRFMIPILDVRNRVIAFGGRVLGDAKRFKYLNSPENIVYSKGKHLFGLNVAKRYEHKKLLIVEGYMDAISLHQRGITNVVAALGTALTTNQGWLLRKNAEQVILGFDADGAGQNAIMRAMEVMQNMGCDMRVLQMTGAKDPDEFIIKYGSARFQKLMNEAISLLEFRVKVLEQSLDLEVASDKVKFLNEIAKLIAKIDNTIEQEIYIEKLSKGYNISKEAIFGQVNKLQYSNKAKVNNLEKAKPVVIHKREEKVNNNVPDEVIKRENTIISILINNPENFQIIKHNMKVEDFKYELNNKIVKALYQELEKEDSNINLVLDKMEDEEIKNHLTAIMAEDYGITDNVKAIEDILKKYEREKLEKRRDELILQSSNENDPEKRKKLSKELNDVILKLVKIK